MTDVAKTRAIYNLLIGQIIEQTLGIDAVRVLFEAAENGDESAKEKIAKAGATGKAPSGFLAVDLGFVGNEIKEALLTAQAAERTLLTLEAMENFYDVHVPQLSAIKVEEKPEEKPSDAYNNYATAINDYYTQNIKPADVDNKMYQFIGTKGEGDALVLAQATQQLAAEYYRNEQMGWKTTLLKNPLAIGSFSAMGKAYIDGFKHNAAKSFRAAADVLLHKGYAEPSGALEGVAVSIVYDKAQAMENTPKVFAETAQGIQKNLTQAESNIYLNNKNVTDVRHITIEINADWDNKMTIRARQAIGLAA